MATNLRAVIGKLNDTTRNALEAAAGLCVSRAHYDIEIEHFLVKLLDATGSDFASSCGISASTARGWPRSWRAAWTS